MWYCMNSAALKLVKRPYVEPGIPGFEYQQKIFEGTGKPGSMSGRRFWIIVASREHVMLGVNGGFAMANHGKRSGLSRMHAGDRIVYYSPKDAVGSSEPLHAFTALGEVADDTIEQVEMSPDFRPFRRRVRYQYTGIVKIEPLVAGLGFIRNKNSWGYVFRFGLLEIPEEDFRYILSAFEKEGKPAR